MLAQQLIRDGDLTGALGALQDAVRKDAAKPQLRTFLFQLLSVQGQWNRALTQLNVTGELDAGALPMVQTYREAIQCEALREAIFAGQHAPHIFGQPQPWLAQLVEALRLDREAPGQAAALRAQAFEQAPATAGSIDGERFEWLADADPRLGPVLEAIVNGRYFWIPFERIARIEIDAPTDLRDAVWTAANFTWANGAQTVGLIPTRYQGTLAAGDDALKLARRTEWQGDLPLGQRMFASDTADHALMDVRVIDFDVEMENGTEADAGAGQEADHG